METQKLKQGKGAKIVLERGLDLPLLVEHLQATKVERPAQGTARAETVHAYDVTLRAILPEADAAVLMSRVKDHKVTVRLVVDRDEGEVLA